jgi:hypothetical protein
LRATNIAKPSYDVKNFLRFPAAACRYIEAYQIGVVNIALLRSESTPERLDFGKKTQGVAQQGSKVLAIIAND